MDDEDVCQPCGCRSEGVNGSSLMCEKVSVATVVTCGKLPENYNAWT